MPEIKIISGHSNPGGSTVANIGLCNLFNDNGQEATFYGPHDWHMSQCRADKTRNLHINEDDFLIFHYLVMPERPATTGKIILTCHEKHNFPIVKINCFWDEIHFVSESQREWQRVKGVVIPNRITKLVSRAITNGVAGVIGSVQRHKQVHVSIGRALNDGFKKVLIYGELNEPDYYKLHVKPYVDSGKVEIMKFEDNMQKMYDSVEVVYHSSESETFNYIKAECAATGTRYCGMDTADPDVNLYNDDEIFKSWLDLLGIS